MTGRRIHAFFYGLFMDADVLREHGVTPVDPRRAYVDHYALRIGRRATLVPEPGARAYGVLFSLTHDDLAALYADLERYRPEAVLARALEGDAIPALCYNLPGPPASAEADPAYAARLRSVLAKLGFPDEYIASIG